MYQELSFGEDYINGNQVLVRRYGDGEITNEDVYIARERAVAGVLTAPLPSSASSRFPRAALAVKRGCAALKTGIWIHFIYNFSHRYEEESSWKHARFRQERPSIT